VVVVGAAELLLPDDWVEPPQPARRISVAAVTVDSMRARMARIVTPGRDSRHPDGYAT
jgi:hypothetical protein